MQDKDNGRHGKLLSELAAYDPNKPFIFTTPGFWLFLLLVLAGYSLIYRKLFIRNFYLLLVSLFFYYKTGGLFLLLLVLVTVTDYLCGILIHRSESRAGKRLFLLVSLLSNLGILAYFKYTGFIVDTINRLAGTDFMVYDFLASFSNSLLHTGFDINTIILPAGISFFTFQSLSYTFDIYRGKLEPVRNISDFGFYVSFFPQLVAGPIVRASEFIPQLHEPFSLSKREFSHAVFMISKGLIKKIVISDFLAVNFVDRVFDMPAMYSGFENLMAVYGYGLQIYCDFSGYTDIAIGIALILGFRLPVNFNSPYKAVGISDFWKRWHISLSRWLKDYLYIPLGGNRRGKLRTGFNLMITMLLGGLWHGAALRFLLWGGFHGVGLVAGKIWNSMVGSRFKPRRIWKIIGIFLTFNFVSFCWIFFRAPETESAILMLKQIAENFSPGSYISLMSAYSGVLVVMAAGYLLHFLPESVREAYRGVFIRIPMAVQLLLVMLLAVFLIQMRTTEVMPFIYFRF
ncbi:MAG: MBOAT family protein [Bacteroidales bacterium]|nr:MBOAT family protein [Bacteroidales bacterium]